jgi:peptidoglycan/LPS O-acetylase OafA/YrhL
MFGMYRTLLAVAVVADHYAPANGAGAVAVFAFWTLSGFLMTILMTGPYRGRPAAFLLNRALRLYPLYLLLVAITGVLAIALPKLQTGIAVPDDPLRVMRQILYYVRFEEARLIPPAWAVTNELVCFILVAFGLAATRGRAIAWFVGSVAVSITIYCRSAGSIFDLYFPFSGILLPFSVGVLLAHWRHAVPILPRRIAGATLAVGSLGTAGLMALAVLLFSLPLNPFIVPLLYLSLAPAAMIILVLDQGGGPSMRRIDDHIGRLSYPMYLSQSVVAEIVYAAWPAQPFGVFWPVLFGTAALSVILAFLDAPAQRLRQRVRMPASLSTRAGARSAMATSS